MRGGPPPIARRNYGWVVVLTSWASSSKSKVDRGLWCNANIATSQPAAGPCNAPSRREETKDRDVYRRGIGLSLSLSLYTCVHTHITGFPASWTTKHPRERTGAPAKMARGRMTIRGNWNGIRDIECFYVTPGLNYGIGTIPYIVYRGFSNRS